MSEYLVIYEQGDSGWAAYCPDLPGLGVAGATRTRVEDLIREGIDVHIASLREHGEAVPKPSSTADVVAVAVA